MCGIAGIVGPSIERESIEAMVAAQAHRGPDDYGIWIDTTRSVAFGHNRLSIIDLSPGGHQPITDGQGLWLTFNGEIYNYQLLRQDLRDYPFRSKSDSEVILAAWRKWGKACIQRFVGMFSFAIWDEKSRRLFCARDRLGKKPFHYAWLRGRFLFGSEIKSLIAAGLPAQANERIWADYLVHGLYDHSDETFFESVKVLPAGHFAELVDGKLTIDRYWDPRPQSGEQLQLSDDAAADHLLALMEESVRQRLIADVPVGLNLSGGLDSSMMMAITDHLLSNSAGSIETFTASFGDPRYDEDSFADRIPRRNQWRRHVVRTSPQECWDLLQRGLWNQEAPFGGIATVAYHKLHAEARRRGIIVLLEAQGADEIFAGYPYFLPAYWRDLLEQRRHAQLRRELRAFPPQERQRWLAHLRSLLGKGALSIHYDGTSHLAMTGVSASMIERAGQAPQLETTSSGGYLANALWRDTRYAKLPRVLRMNDRLSMASGTELRAPFLDHRVVEFSFRLPSDQKIRLGQGKFLPRHAMRHLLPAEVAHHRKRTVVTPQREWLRGPLRSSVDDVLASRSFAERGWFDVPAARKAFADFADGKGDNSFFVWQWINAELWCRHFIDSAGQRTTPRLSEAYGTANTVLQTGLI
jgi:asparagine synthase (glutamine-hydrolysing)